MKKIVRRSGHMVLNNHGDFENIDITGKHVVTDARRDDLPVAFRDRQALRRCDADIQSLDFRLLGSVYTTDRQGNA